LIKKQSTIFIITGKPGSGKTTFLAQLSERLLEHNLSISGFLAKRSVADEQQQIYEIHLFNTGKSISLASREAVNGWIKMDHFYFNPEALKSGNKILTDSLNNENDLIIIDEIGIFELKDKIWADSVSLLVSKSKANMIWVVRDTLIEKVKHKWNLLDPVIIDIKNVSIRQAEKRILSVF